MTGPQSSGPLNRLACKAGAQGGGPNGSPTKSLHRSCGSRSPARREPPAQPRPHTPTNTAQFLRKVLRRACSEELPCEMCRVSCQDKKLEDVAFSSSSTPNSPRREVSTNTRQSRHHMTSSRECELIQQMKTIVPRLSYNLKKGECGTIAIFGGCVMFTGSAYFAAISALKSGSDLVHVFCEKEAGPTLMSYSAELIVHPVLDQEYWMEEIDYWLPKLHCVVLGHGLGRNQSMGGRLAIILERVKARGLPLVLDADGLWYLAINPGMLRGYKKAVITPNPEEFTRLAKSVLHRNLDPSICPDRETVADLAKALGHVTVLHKGAHDVISDGHLTEECQSGGSPRRCGGQGDLLAGVVATFLSWVHVSETELPPSPYVVAAWGASRLVRACGSETFALHGRSMSVQDLVAGIQSQFRRLYESETFL